MPKIVTISTKDQQGFECYRCGWQWVPFHSSIEEPPGFCPNSRCKSPYWGEHYLECRDVGGGSPRPSVSAPASASGSRSSAADPRTWNTWGPAQMTKSLRPFQNNPEPPDEVEHHPVCAMRMGLLALFSEPSFCICAEVAEALKQDAAESKFDAMRERGGEDKG